MEDIPDLETAKIALEVSRESVTKQQADIRDLRTAAAALLTGSSVVVSFLGGRALDLHRFPLLVVAGVVFFVGSLVLVITVLIPRRGKIKEIASGSTLFELTLDTDEPSTDAYVRLSQTYDEIYQDNDAPKRRLIDRLVVAATLVVLQIGAWGAVIVLADRGVARPADTQLPTIRGTATAGAKVTCSAGTWANGPTSFAYRWSRDGTPIQKAMRSSYAIKRSDEGLTLTCAVTASNARGSGLSALSHGVVVAVPDVAHCPAATGKLRGRTLGFVRLGMTRSQARNAYKRSSDHHTRDEDFFCLTPNGVHVGYPSPTLLASLPRRKRRRFTGRAIWAMTSNAYYAVDHIRVGATITAARRLRTSAPFLIGVNTWYLAPRGASTVLLDVRHGIIEEMGIGDSRLTGDHTTRHAFLRSLVTDSGVG